MAVINKIKTPDGVERDLSVNWNNVENAPDMSLYAPKASPTLTGVPTAPTPAAGTSTD